MKSALEQMDIMRRRRGKMLDAAGFGPVETPYRVVHTEAGVSLRRYAGGSDQGPVLLIVPAPIKQAYIWDLAPQISVVRRCIGEGMRVYLAEWTPVGDAEQQFGLAEYGDRLLQACVDTIAADSGEAAIVLAGHSLGGVLATTFACLHAQQVSALLLLEAPLHFGADAGKFAPWVASLAAAAPIGKTFGTVPGSFLNIVSVAAAPDEFQWQRYLDWSRSLADAEALRTHMRVERWMHDEFPLPGTLFVEIVEWLYREDRLMRGCLRIGKRQVGPGDVTAPLLNVIHPRSTIIPPQSILPFHQAAASTSKKLLCYEGDVGVAIQHVGALVGSGAHATLWPAIFDWLAAQGVMRRGP